MRATPQSVLRAVTARDGHQSAWTGDDSETLVPQHRQGGMGGSPTKHRLSNVVWLESHTNGDIESDPAMQAEAYSRGIKVSRFVDVAAVPILHAVHGWVLLDDEGGVTPVDAPDDFAEWRSA